MAIRDAFQRPKINMYLVKTKTVIVNITRESMEKIKALIEPKLLRYGKKNAVETIVDDKNEFLILSGFVMVYANIWLN